MRAESSLQSLRHGLKPEMIDEFEEDSLNSTSLSPIALSTIKLRTDTTTSSLREECFEMILAKLKGQLVS